MDPTRVLAGLLALLLVSSASFVVDVSGSRHPDPVPFEDTIRVGMTSEATVSARASGYEIPSAQVFYSQYRYVVGYYGVTTMVDSLARPENDRQFGTPLVIYVTDYAGHDVTVDADGYLHVQRGFIGSDDWTDAEDAHYVVGSRARTPTGEAVVPFSDAAEARAFADAHGGEVVGWDGLRERDFRTGVETRERLGEAVEERRAWADRTVERTSPLLDRPVSVVVGEDAPTLAAAVEEAPPNTTVAVPEGTYDAANVTIRKPLTVRGVGNETHLRGDGTGSVLRAFSPGVAVADLRIDGVGNATTREEIPRNESEWDYRVQMGYGFGDAGVVLDGANGSLVRHVSVTTPANGVLVRSTDGAVVDGVTVHGSESWLDGFMGVMLMDSRVVVQRSTFEGGRDGIYTHISHGFVARDNHFSSMRFGVHEMYTSNALIEGNYAEDTALGVVVMTRPTGNAIVDNEVRNSEMGVSVVGSSTLVKGNVVVGNGYGLAIGSRGSFYEGNTVVGNDAGVRTTALIPTNVVVGNDFVDNGRYVVAPLGPLRVWSTGAEGNYWSGAPGRDSDADGALDRPFHPTGPVDGRINRVAGTPTLAHSPALVALRELQDVVPGLRATGVVDAAPRVTPANPDALRSLNATATPTTA